MKPYRIATLAFLCAAGLAHAGQYSSEINQGPKQPSLAPSKAAAPASDPEPRQYSMRQSSPKNERAENAYSSPPRQASVPIARQHSASL